jgi:site-specific recombinase XerD
MENQTSFAQHVYVTGGRLMEGVRLRIRTCFDRHVIIVREWGNKDRVVDAARSLQLLRCAYKC